MALNYISDPPRLLALDLDMPAYPTDRQGNAIPGSCPGEPFGPRHINMFAHMPDGYVTQAQRDVEDHYAETKPNSRRRRGDMTWHGWREEMDADRPIPEDFDERMWFWEKLRRYERRDAELQHHRIVNVRNYPDTYRLYCSASEWNAVLWYHLRWLTFVRF